MICDPGAVVLVPYPFVDHPVVKVRPALVLSSRRFNSFGDTLTAMITTAARSRWPGDLTVCDWAAAGLKRPCIIRFKIVTLQNEAIFQELGALSASDARAARDGMLRVLSVGL